MRRAEDGIDEVYFMQAKGGGPIKIGHGEPSKRRRDCQTGNPFELVICHTLPGGLQRERRLHERFAADRIRGEWFAPSESLVRLSHGRPHEAADTGAAFDAGWHEGFQAALCVNERARKRTRDLQDQLEACWLQLYGGRPLSSDERRASLERLYGRPA